MAEKWNIATILTIHHSLRDFQGHLIHLCGRSKAWNRRQILKRHVTQLVFEVAEHITWKHIGKHCKNMNLEFLSVPRSTVMILGVLHRHLPKSKCKASMSRRQGSRAQDLSRLQCPWPGQETSGDIVPNIITTCFQPPGPSHGWIIWIFRLGKDTWRH